MKREFKFRAYIKDEGRLLDVNLIDFDDEYVRVWDEYGENEEEWLFKDCELMQYIGLDDVNGVEIYENDIVKSNYKYAQPKISQIIMEDGNSYIAGEDLATGNEMLVSDHIDEIEVIGNIHANHELLEERK